MRLGGHLRSNRVKTPTHLEHRREVSVGGNGLTKALTRSVCEPWSEHSSPERASRRFGVRADTLEMAVLWGWGVDAAFGTLGDELEGDGAGRNGALVSDEVDVVPSVIDEAHALGVDVGFAVGVVASVFGHGSFCDDDQAVTRVGVPAGASSGLPDVVLDVQVGRAFGLL